MDLVAYSDSDGSDAEPNVNSNKDQSRAPKLSQSEVRRAESSKFVDSSNPRRINVALPAITPDDNGNHNEPNIDIRPSKRPRTGRFSGDFNSLLPAPKKSAKQNSTLRGQSRPSQPGADSKGARDLKLLPSSAITASPLDVDLSEKASEVLPLPPTAEEGEVKLVGKVTMFKPLSVARKPSKKKNLVSQSAQASYSNESTDSRNVLNEQKRTEKIAKKALFSSFEEATVDEVQTLPSTATYVEPSRIHGLSIPHSPVGDPHVDEGAQSTSIEVPGAHDSQSLQSLASSLALTPSQRRQLFGRKAKDMALVPDAHVAQFSLAVEYSNNNDLCENEMNAPVHNPVRTIGSGKHSLQQLVNAATSQKDALEESFAIGKANKKGSGSKYGW